MCPALARYTTLRRCARADPAPSKTDLDRRVHDVANVLVIGATSFTRYIRVNLQMMTMAMAHYATEHDPF